IVPQPEREGARVFADPPTDLVARQERNLGDLGRIGSRLRREPPEIDVDVFVLAHAVTEVGSVAREEAERQGARQPELLAEPAARGRKRALAGTRVAATGIRPQAAGVIFFRASPLQQDAAAIVDDEDREGAVQQAGAVSGGLAGAPDRAVAF